MPRKKVSSGAINYAVQCSPELIRDTRTDASQIHNGVIAEKPGQNRYSVAGKSLNFPSLVQSVDTPVRSVNAGQCRPDSWERPFYKDFGDRDV